MAASSSSSAAAAAPAEALAGVPGSAFGYAWTPTMWPSSQAAAMAASELGRPRVGISEDEFIKRPRMAKWSPDGKLLATASDSDRVRVCKIQPDGRLGSWGSLTGHKEAAHAVAWAPAASGLVCYSAGREGTLRVWDLAKGRCIRVIQTAPRVIHIAASPDGRFFSAGTMRDVVTVFDARTLATVSCTAMPHETNAQVWTPRGELMVACGRKGVEGGLVVRLRPRACKAPAEGARPVPLGSAACGLELVKEIPVLAGAARVLSESPAGDVFAVGGVDSCVALLDSATDACLRVIDAGAGAVIGAEFSRDGRHLAIATRDAPVRIVRSADGSTVRQLEGTQAKFAAPAWHPTSDRLAVLSDTETRPTSMRLLSFE